MKEIWGTEEQAKWYHEEGISQIQNMCHWVFNINGTVPHLQKHQKIEEGDWSMDVWTLLETNRAVFKKNKTKTRIFATKEKLDGRLGIRWQKGSTINFGDCVKVITVIMFLKSPYHSRMHIPKYVGVKCYNICCLL